MRILVILIFVSVLSQAGFPQEGKLIEVKSANVLNVKTINNQEVRELIGNVHLVQIAPNEIIKIWCDSALRYMDLNKVELFGRVKIIRDSVTLTAPQGLYYGDERRAEMSKGVKLTKGSMTLTSRFGEYFAGEKRARFVGDVHVVDSASSTSSNELTYFEDEEKSIAIGNVKVFNPANNVTIFGDSLVHFDKRHYTIVPKNPKLVQIDTAASGTIDTLVVISKLMESYRDTAERFIAREQVAMVRTDFAARCGEAIYSIKKDNIILREQPVVWHQGSQITGDSIVVTMNDRRLRSVYVKGRAMAISRADSLRTERYDQLTGREITMYFAHQKLEQVEADRNAISLYYLFEDGEPNGVNRSSGDKIVIEFQEGKTDRIRIVGGVEGRYYPEPMLDKRERQYNLDGFKWLENRPLRRKLNIVSEPNE